MQIATRYTLLLTAAVAVTTLTVFNNCGQVQFSSSTPTSLAQGTPVVCNPFGGGGTTSANQGLVAQGVYYINQAQLTTGQDPGSVINDSVENLVNPTSPLVVFESIPVFLTDINFPAMYFTQGFINGETGHALQDTSGNTLTSYFGFRLSSNFIEGNWPDGDYQIATLTDDGSVLTMTGAASNGGDFVINNDDFHSMQMGCSTQTIHVTSNSSIPLTFDYMQGPPTTIGMMMLYRPVSVAGQAQDPLCGQGNQSDSYFFLDHNGSKPLNPSVAQAPYLQLTGPFDPSTGTGGWMPVESNHFQLPNNTTNPCANGS